MNLIVKVNSKLMLKYTEENDLAYFDLYSIL